MRPTSRPIVLIAALLLLAAPAAWACGEVLSAMACCPLMDAMPSGNCHGQGDLAMDCCATDSSSDPMAAPPADGARPSPAPVGLVSSAILPARAAAQPRIAAPELSSRIHDLGRYTLFSSFLL